MTVSSFSFYIIMVKLVDIYDSPRFAEYNKTVDFV